MGVLKLCLFGSIPRYPAHLMYRCTKIIILFFNGVATNVFENENRHSTVELLMLLYQRDALECPLKSITL